MNSRMPPFIRADFRFSHFLFKAVEIAIQRLIQGNKNSLSIQGASGAKSSTALAASAFTAMMVIIFSAMHTRKANAYRR